MCIRDRAQLVPLAQHPLVGEVRGSGLLAAVEIVANKQDGSPLPPAYAGYLQQACQDHGLIARAVAGTSIALCPPLIITTEQIDEMVEALTQALDEILDRAVNENLLVS